MNLTRANHSIIGLISVVSDWDGVFFKIKLTTSYLYHINLQTRQEPGLQRLQFHVWYTPFVFYHTWVTVYPGPSKVLRVEKIVFQSERLKVGSGTFIYLMQLDLYYLIFQHCAGQPLAKKYNNTFLCLNRNLKKTLHWKSLHKSLKRIHWH